MIEIKEHLKINQLVNIEVISESCSVCRYPSRVEDLKEEGIILVTPLKDRIPVYLSPGTKLNIIFLHNKNAYTFSTSLLKNIQGHVYFLMVAIPESIERVQKREFVRVESVFEVLLTYKNSENKEEKISCQSKDISGGGLQLAVTKTNLPEHGSEVQLEFYLNDKLIKATGILVWNTLKRDTDGKERNYIAVKFTKILEADRTVIIKEVYLRQIELRRKGLL